HPKRRQSKSRRNKRRTHYKATVPSYADCPNCHEPKLLHRACPNCGYYNGRSIIILKES
ncbi:MAG: 50S ribosomal protein L32, partial [Bacteroidota bacterium]